MESYYLILRIRPETDFQGKSEAEILKKIEANYKALVARETKIHSAGAERDKILKELDEAKAVLSDQGKREAYDKQLKEVVEKGEKEGVTIEIEELTDEMIEEIDKEIEREIEEEEGREE